MRGTRGRQTAAKPNLYVFSRSRLQELQKSSAPLLIILGEALSSSKAAAPSKQLHEALSSESAVRRPPFSVVGKCALRRSR